MDRILVVDDEPDIVNLVRMILEKGGYWVSVASSGDAALEVIGTEIPDLVLLDLVMPGKSGLEVCKIIKSHPRNKNIPVVMFTALDRDVDRNLSKWAGADAHFVKPFTKSELLMEVERCLRDSKSSKFSRQLGIDHSQLRGKKVLFEFDPQSDYETVISDLAEECAFHDETLMIVTQTGNPIQRAIESSNNVLLLDLDPTTRFSAVLNQHPDGPLNLVFDSITGLALLEKSEEDTYNATYRFAQNSLHILDQPRITALFLLNPAAHDSRDVASLRGIFSNQLVYNDQGLAVVKLENNRNGKEVKE
jgi:DNA-binding response OmpR family regulator